MKTNSFSKRCGLVLAFVLVLGVGVTPEANADFYYPSGPQLEVPVSTVTSGGWELCFENSFDANGTPVQTMLDQCTGKYIMLAGAYNVSPNTIALLAAGERASVFQVQTVYNQKTLNNGTYFYFFPTEGCESQDPGNCGFFSNSIGFSKSSVTTIRTCDTGSVEGSLKLCRHIVDQSFDEGYRIGTEISNENLQAAFRVYQSAGDDSEKNRKERDAAAAAAAAAQRQRELTEIFSLVPAIAGLALTVASLTNVVLGIPTSTTSKQKCVKATSTKYVKKGAKCPPGYKKR